MAPEEDDEKQMKSQPFRVFLQTPYRSNAMMLVLPAQEQRKNQKQTRLLSKASYSDYATPVAIRDT